MAVVDRLLETAIDMLDPAEQTELMDQIDAYKAANGFAPDEREITNAALSYISLENQSAMIDFLEETEPQADAPLISEATLASLSNLPGVPLEDDSDEPLTPEDMLEVQAVVDRFEAYAEATADEDGVDVEERLDELEAHITAQGDDLDAAIVADDRWRSLVEDARAKQDEPKVSLHAAIDDAFKIGGALDKVPQPYKSERNAYQLEDGLSNSIDDVVDDLAASHALNDLAAQVAAN